jgi:hypothetical protein
MEAISSFRLTFLACLSSFDAAKKAPFEAEPKRTSLRKY